MLMDVDKLQDFIDRLGDKCEAIADNEHNYKRGYQNCLYDILGFIDQEFMSDNIVGENLKLKITF